MSQICICVVNQNAFEKVECARSLLLRYGLFTCNELSYDEPCLHKARSENKIILSISDDCLLDNCEMFLLPDNCTYNGRSNKTPFTARMQLLQNALSLIVDKNTSLEMFVGDSGTPYCDFEHHSITIHDFLRVSSRLNSITPPDLHLSFR